MNGLGMSGYTRSFNLAIRECASFLTSMQTYIFPRFDNVPLAEVTSADVPQAILVAREKPYRGSGAADRHPTNAPTDTSRHERFDAP